MSQDLHEQQHVEEQARDTRARQLQSSRLRIALFKNLQVESPSERGHALEKIIQVVKSFMRVAHSPSASDTGADTDEDGTDEQLQYLLLTMLRLAHTCPFSDNTSIPVPHPAHRSPSSFISAQDIFSLESTSSYPLVNYPRPANLSFSPWSHEAETEGMDEPFDVKLPQRLTRKDSKEAGRPADEYVRQLMVKTFVDEGRLLHLFRVMVFFPTFYEIFNVTYTKTVKATIGPLHRTWRCYLGIMTAAEQQCQYLVSILKLDFLQAGGDPAWLQGRACPPKLWKLSGLIKRMARQPWKLHPRDLSEWMGAAAPGLAWTKGELVHAVLVITTFLGLSSFVLGCGISPELDMRGGFTVSGNSAMDGIEQELSQHCCFLPDKEEQEEAEEESEEESHGATGWQGETPLHGPRLEKKEEEEEALDLDLEKKRTVELIHRLKAKDPIKEEWQDTLGKLQLSEAQETAGPCLETPSTTHDKDHGLANRVLEDLTRFAPPQPQWEEEEPFTSHPNHQEFMLSEYCWEDHGCDLVNHFLPEIGDDLDDEFNEALSITDWSIFHPVADGAVDTSPLRHAIWFYVQQLYGVTKEDYHYPDIALYLSQRTKEYINKVCRQPHLIQRSDWHSMGISFRPEEKCHMNLLIASAKKQALLCYGLWLISEV
ncbi:PA26 p53-induced protein-domain-containing protein [Spinellus fusiger]|nr:PA26 p53-induced protein-domain-containing protein [Spinellus fusiger]